MIFIDPAFLGQGLFLPTKHDEMTLLFKTSSRIAFVITFFLCRSRGTADFIYPDSLSTDGGQFNASFPVENLTNESLTLATDTISATAANSGLAYATADPPAGGYPVTVIVEFNSETDLSAFYLWNNSTNATIASKGIQDFTLKFYDAPGGAAGGGAQVGADYSETATEGPTTGAYAAEQFVFESTYAGVRSVELIITNNFLGSSWVGARELAFDGTASYTAIGLVYPDAATTTGGEFNTNFSVTNVFNEGLTSLSDTLDAAALNSEKGYASEESAGFPVTLTLEFSVWQDLQAFYLWNNATSATISSKGVKDFTLKFYDSSGGAVGGGDQVGSDYISSAAQGPTSGNYAAEQFIFPSTYVGVKSVDLIIDNNHLGSSWVGLRELAFDGEVSLADPSVTRVLVYLVGGQSNADGYGIASELPIADQAPTPEVRFYHGNGGGESALTAHEWIDLQTGSGSKSGNAGGFGPELQFGRDVHAQLGAEKSRIAIIKHTVGGTNLYADWIAGGDASTSGDGAIYQAFQTTVANGLAGLVSFFPNAIIQIEGMIWHQGEGDVNGGEHNNYQTNLTNFIADLRLTYGSELRFVIAQLSNNQWSAGDATKQARCDVVQAAQQSVADASAYNGLIATEGLAPSASGGIIHFATEAYLTTGARFAEAMLRLPITDTDGNGLDDDWEITHFGTKGQSPGDDADFDGWSNQEEHDWQSSPVSANSRPAVTIGDAGNTLEWTPESGRRYYVQQSTDLAVWTTLESFISSTAPALQSWTMPNLSTEKQVFFRVGVQR